MNIVIRFMCEADEIDINDAFAAMGWGRRPGLFLRYMAQEAAGERRTFVAVGEGRPLGYITLLIHPRHGPFAGKGWPEVSDFNVFAAYRRQGIGSMLMDAAEEAASELSPVVTIGVGLHSGYGSAQRMYVKRGYVPDGSGVWYRGEVLPEQAPCCNDDDLVLYFSKPTDYSVK